MVPRTGGVGRGKKEYIVCKYQNTQPRGNITVFKKSPTYGFVSTYNQTTDMTKGVLTYDVYIVVRELRT